MSWPRREVVLVENIDQYAKIDVGGGVSLLIPAEGKIRVMHVCAEWDDDYMQEHLVKIACPTLHEDHVVVSLDPPTIQPSILCSSCGLHGFVRSGVWVPA